MFKMMTGVDMVHVPYHGSAPELTDLIGGHVQIAFEPIQSCLGYIKAGTLHALAVSTAARTKALPDVPTLGEFIPGFEARTWQGLGAPKHLPAEIVEVLNKEVNAALTEPALQTRLAADLKHRADADGPGGMSGLHHRRGGEVGEGHQICQHQAGVSPTAGAQVRE